MQNEANALQYTCNTFSYEPQNLNLNIPPALWHAMDDSIHKQINCIRRELQERRTSKNQNTKSPTPIGDQYPTIALPPNKLDNALTTVQRAATQNLLDNNSVSTIKDNVFDLHINSTTTLTFQHDYLTIHASFRLACKCVTEDQIIYGISDEGADSTILGQDAHVLNHTGRYARLVGYDPDNTTFGQVPIVSADQKSMDSNGNKNSLSHPQGSSS